MLPRMPFPHPHPLLLLLQNSNNKMIQVQQLLLPSSPEPLFPQPQLEVKLPMFVASMFVFVYDVLYALRHVYVSAFRKTE